VYSLCVDDFASGLVTRFEARSHVNRLMAGDVGDSAGDDEDVVHDGPTPSSQLEPHTFEWYEARDRELRADWGWHVGGRRRRVG
jgi:hypothetical protein